MNKDTAIRQPKETPLATSIAIWIVPVISLYAWVLTFVFSFSRSELQNINDATAEGSSGNKLFWLLMLCAALFAWKNHQKAKADTLNTHIYILAAYTAFEIFSALWSDVPLISLRRSLQQAIVVFCILSPFLLGIDKNRILIKICGILAFFVGLNVLLIPLLGIPDFGYKGICPQKNILGQISTIAFFFCVYASIKSSGRNRLLFKLSSVLAVALCYISNSKTSLALLVVVPVIAGSILLVANIKPPLTRTIMTLVCIMAGFLVICASLLIPFDIYDISNLLFHDRTFTGRTAIWEFAGHYIDQSPIIGYGYGSFWGVGSATRAIGEGFIGGLLQAHDGYVDIVLELGYVGLATTILFIVSLSKSILKTADHDKWLALLLLACLLFVLLNNTMESSLFRSYVPMWVTLLLCVGLTSKVTR